MTRSGWISFIMAGLADSGALILNTMTFPVFVPTARKRARWPGIAADEEPPCSAGVANGEEVVELPLATRIGSSLTVSNANVDLSMLLVVILTREWSFNKNTDARHSSTRLARDFLNAGVPGRLGDLYTVLPLQVTAG